MSVCQVEVSENSITNQLTKAAVQNCSLKGRKVLPPQSVDATHALNLSAGVSNPKVLMAA